MAFQSHKDTINLLLFEVVERIARFFLHVRQIRAQLELTRRPNIHDEFDFLASYDRILVEIFTLVLSLINSEDHNGDAEAADKSIDVLRTMLAKLRELHKNHLAHLPRPIEPIELRRFGRLINNHLVELRDFHSEEASKISIYVTEDLGESVFRADPLAEFRDMHLKEVSKMVNALRTERRMAPLAEDTPAEGRRDALHITIPRIDANNPCRWATLLHEVAHRLGGSQLFSGKSILEAFRGDLTPEQQAFLGDIEDKIDVKSWLFESWCDAFAAIAIGPAFWFSQFLAFLFAETEPKTSHPPALFRLKLIDRMLLQRYKDVRFDELRQAVKAREALIITLERRDGVGLSQDPELVVLYTLIQQFLSKHLFREGDVIGVDDPVLSKGLAAFVKFTQQINQDIVAKLVDELNSGLPVPGVVDSRINNTAERPTSLQEILLAASISRGQALSTRVLSLLPSISVPAGPADLKILADEFDKFDQCVLRSIQVAEWFFALDPAADPERPLHLPPVSSLRSVPEEIGGHYLNDRQIGETLDSGALRVIPIIDRAEQLGSNSLDIRLGTGFQLYFPNRYGVIDFVDSRTVVNADANSRLIDLDFLESITVAPNQFLLGHSLEYIKIPSHLCGLLEGRSSFARLGLEVHMTAGFVDPGFEGVLTFEAFNAGPNPIRLFPGFRIAQIRFSHVSPPDKSYKEKASAKYRGLLYHDTTRQFRDAEVRRLRREIDAIADKSRRARDSA